jgi:hypothetical protein
LTLGEDKHPADEIGKALLRAGGILTSIANCYDRSGTAFVVSTPFVAEAITAVEAILSKAAESLAQLYENCDLTLLSVSEGATTETNESEVQPETQTQNIEESWALEPQTPEPMAPELQTEKLPDNLPDKQSDKQPDGAFIGQFGQAGSTSRLAQKLDSILETLPPAREYLRPEDMMPRPEDMIEQPAQTYEELLEKLTAMADAAAYQAHKKDQPTSPLLPMLESLRADLLRIKTVA